MKMKMKNIVYKIDIIIYYNKKYKQQYTFTIYRNNYIKIKLQIYTHK